MGEEHGDLLEDRGAARMGLLPRGRNADNDVAEDVTGQRTELAFMHRERKDVGRAILSAIDLVQLVDAIIVG